MRNLLYITMEDDLNNNSNGVIKKIYAQKQVFEENGLDVFLSGFCEGKYIIKGCGVYEEINLIKPIWCMEYFIYKFILKMIKKLKIKSVYIRRVRASMFSLDFMRKMKLDKVKILMEIPTYPYDGEVKTFKGKISLTIDRFYRNQFSKFLDKIVTFSNDEYIFGVKCINISNGIKATEIWKEYPKKNNSCYEFISVSSLAEWHGVDRFIKSMKNSKENNIKLNIVGPENDYTLCLRELVKNYALENKVIFHGFLNKERVDEIYKEMHIAIGSLGRHRSGVVVLSSLKNREYLSKGLPMIYSEQDLDFDGKEFVYKVLADESLFEIDLILDWYSRINIEESQMLKIAQEFSWENQLLPVVKELIG